MKWNIDSSLAAMIEAMLPRFSNQEVGLHFILRLSFDDFGFAKDGNTQTRKEWHKSFNIEYLIHRPSNYTKVLVRVTKDNLRDSLNEPYEMELASDHDSCWKTDGFDHLFQCLKEAMQQHEENTGCEWFGNAIGFHSFEFCGSPKYIKLKTIKPKDPADNYNRSRIVVAEKTMSIKEAAKYLG